MAMSKEEKEKRAADAAALLVKNLEEAQAAFNALDDTATEEAKGEAQAAIDAAQAAIDAAQAAIDAANALKGKLVKVKFLLSPTGRFGLGYHVGEEGKFEAKQAEELVESKYAEYVK